MREVDFDEGLLKIKFTAFGTEFSDLLNLVKSFPGRLYMPDLKYWTAPPIKKTVQILKESQFVFTQNARSLLLNDFVKPETQSISGLSEKQKEKLKGFRDYQIEGVQFLERRNGFGGVFDQMGLGKTIQAIGYAKIHPEIRPLLVVCPASVKLKWMREIIKWTGERVEILSGKTPVVENLMFKADWYVINYDILAKETKEIGKNGKEALILEGWFETLIGIGIKGVIGDEVQYVSNQKAIRTKAFKRIVRKCKELFIPLSGTPLRNRPAEFFTILNLLDNNTFANHWSYLNRYCNPKYNGFGWTFSGATNIEELHELVAPLMIRRLKKNVLKDLPPKQKIVIPMELHIKDAKQYEKEEKDFELFVQSENNSIDEDNHIEHLKQAAYAAKRESVINWIKEFLESGEKLLVAAWHRKVVDEIQSIFKDSDGAVKIYGGVNANNRQIAVDKFQNDPKCKLLICHPDSVIGQDLFSAYAGAVIEFPHTPADCEQFEDRLHRMGQKNPVTIYYLVADGTIENHIMEYLEQKYDVVSGILDGDVQGSLFNGGREDLRKGLIEIYRRRSHK